MSTPKLKLPPKQRCRGSPRVFEETFGLQIHTDMGLMCEETGGDVWLGGMAVANFLCDESNARELVRGKRVVELGAGTGYLSLCAAMLGAESVVATDLPLMVDFIKSQVARNRELMKENESRAATKPKPSNDRDAKSGSSHLQWRRLDRVQTLALDWDAPVTEEVLLCALHYTPLHKPTHPHASHMLSFPHDPRMLTIPYASLRLHTHTPCLCFFL